MFLSHTNCSITKMKFTMSSPQVVPVAAGFNIVTHVPFTIHHNLWQISFCSEHTVSTPSPNCKRHCLEESYSAPVND